jgi:ribosome-associated protein
MLWAPATEPVKTKDGKGTQTLTTALRSEGAAHRAPRLAAVRRDLSPTAALNVVLASLDEAKAEDPVSIDITGKTTIGDHMVVASGRSDRHVSAIANRLIEDLKQAGGRDIRVEGLRACDWVLVDAGDVIVHIFRPEVRAFYNIEKMWRADHPAAPVAV